MSVVKKTIYNVLKGSFLVNEAAFKNWRIIIYVTILLLFMISSAHSIDSKVMKITVLNKEMRALKAKFVDLGSKITHLKMESNVRERTKSLNLLPSKEPPIKLVLKK